MSTNFTLHTTVNDPLTIQQFQALLENLIPTDAITGASLTVVNGQLVLADDSVGTSQLQENAVTSYELADNAVATANLQAGSVTTPKIPDDAVTSAKIQNDAVTSAKIENDAVTTDKVADGAITREKLATDAMGIKSIQRGRFNVGFIVNNISLNPVDPDKCMVILNGGLKQSNGQENPWVESLTSTNLRIQLEDGGSGGKISWQVIEFY